MSDFDHEEPTITLPGYIVKHHVRPGQDPRHLVEHILARLASTPGCWHSFELAWSLEHGQVVAAWVSAPESFWREMLEEAFGTEAEATQEMIAGLEAMLAEQPEGVIIPGSTPEELEAERQRIREEREGDNRG